MDSKGFTIIEVLIALAIFAIGILGVAKLQISSTNYNTNSRVHTEVTSFGSGQIEELMNLDYNDPLLDAGTHGPNPIPNEPYQIQWVVTEGITDTAAADVDAVKRIDVTVTWNRGPDRQFRATYYKAIEY